MLNNLTVLILWTPSSNKKIRSFCVSSLCDNELLSPCYSKYLNKISTSHTKLNFGSSGLKLNNLVIYLLINGCLFYDLLGEHGQWWLLGFLFSSALGPLNIIFSRSRLVWPGWSIEILHKNVVIFKNTTQIINRRIFRVLFVQGTFSNKPFINSGSGIVASINTTNIKVCSFRGLSRDFIKVSIGTFYARNRETS